MRPKMLPSGMGIIEAKVTLFSRDRRRKHTLLLMVDTGSTYTWVPGEEARSLGLRPSEIWKFHTIDGRKVHRPICDAFVECEGRRGVVRTVFARKGDFNVLGVTALEVLGLEVDPRVGVLRKTDASLAVVSA